MLVSKNAMNVLEKRYLVKDSSGRPVESPLGMMKRVSSTLAQAEREFGADDEEVKRVAGEFEAVLTDLDFLPNSPTLANAGTRTGQLSACFVLPVPDDLGGIFEAVKQQALVHQTGGGTGFDFSELREKNRLVKSTGGYASGPNTFIDVFNSGTESIKQGGMRRGANMGILRVDHHDISDFINAKSDLSKLTNFNVSVAVTDEFMAAVKAGVTYALRSPVDGKEVGRLNARDVLKHITERAHATGEPGLVFIDRMNRYCPVPWLGRYAATNPCGEQPLLPYESCNLGSINLERFVIPEGQTVYGYRIDWERLAAVIQTSTHLLDNVISCNRFPLSELQEMSDKTRKVGLGVMGFARMLYLLGIPYDSEDACLVAGQVMSFIDYHSKLASVKLAVSRGAFPAYDADKSPGIYRAWCEERDARPDRHPGCDYLGLADLIEQHGIRNSTTTTIAPTGTIGIIADTSGGCEPVFALAFKRKQADSVMLDADNVFGNFLERAAIDQAERKVIWAGIDDNGGSLRDYLRDLEDGREDNLQQSTITLLCNIAGRFVVSRDLTPENHIDIQAAFQRFNDSATSKTINFERSATVEDVERAYMLAWDLGCKGVTVYRDGSRDDQPLSTAATTEAAATGSATMTDKALSEGWTDDDTSEGKQAPCSACGSEVKIIARFEGLESALAFVHTQAEAIVKRATAPRERAEDLYGLTKRIQTGDGRLYLTLNYDHEGMREVVANVGRGGGALFGLTEAIGRLISVALKHRVPVKELAATLIGIRGPNTYGFGDNAVLSIPDAVGRALQAAPAGLGMIEHLTEDEIGHIKGEAYRQPAPTLEPVVSSPAKPASGGMTKDQAASNRHAVEVLGKSPECTECGGRINFSEGCQTCQACGASKCG